LRSPEALIPGDAKQLETYNLPQIDFSLSSPPGSVTPLAWDIADVISQVLHFNGVHCRMEA